MIVVDASVVAGWLLADERNAYTESVASLIAAGENPCAPNLLLWEVANLLRTAEKRGRLLEGLAEDLLTTLALLPWEWDTPASFLRMPDLIALTRRHGLTAYDSAYLGLARDRKLLLATQDKALTRAAADAGVAIFPVE